MRRHLLVAGFTMFMTAVAVAQTAPVFTADFDKGFDAQGAAGAVTATLEDQPQLAPGRTGQALKSCPETGYVQYPTAGVINPEGGTVEMWVQPLDWKPDEDKFHVFFEVRGEGALYLYKYYMGTRLLMLTCDNVGGPYTSSAFSVDWKPGEWHFIAGTWSSDGVMCYVDGKPAASIPAQGPLPRSFEPTFRIGDHPWQFARTTASLIDDVRIYNRALSPAQIAAHFKGDYNFIVPLSRDLAHLTYEYQPAHNALQVRLNTGGADVPDAQLAARLAVVKADQPLPDDAPVLAFTDGHVAHTLPVGFTQPGTYQVVAEVRNEGKPAFEVRRDFIIPDMNWKDNPLGLEDKVIKPWTPMQVRGTTLSCWGRDYTFAQSALPIQITSRGEDLLAGPIALKLTSGGKDVAWEKQSATVDAHSDTTVNVTGALVANLDGQDIHFTTKITAEYDGVVMIDLSCPTPDRLPLTGMTIDIPVKQDRALYRHRWSPQWQGASGFVPEGDGPMDADKFVPYVWLGDNDRGLFWFCESDQYWPNRQNDNAVQIVRAGEQVILRLNVLGNGQKLDSDWHLSFGLQATPVKPMPKDWRKWRLQPADGANVAIIWPTPKNDSLKYFGYPQATDPAAFTKRVEDLHADGVKCVPYLCLSYISAACEEWPYFKKSWAMGPADAGSSDVAAYGAAFAQVSPVGKNFADFIVWKTTQFIDKYNIDGLYHDNTHPYSSNALDAGCGYERDGKVYPTYPILGYRSLYRRMDAVVQALPRPTFTMAHMSGKVTIPILAYDDSYLDGEHFRHRVKDSYYKDMLTLDAFRAEYMGRQWGIMPFFLPEFDAEHRTQVAPTRGLMALLMIHDVSPWAIWCNKDVVNEALGALDKFGYVDADFLAYFDPVPPATTDMEDVFISAYKRADGCVLLIVANLSREDRSGTIDINAARIGLPLTHVVNWPDEQPLTVQKNSLQLAVPGLSYRMIEVAAP